MSSSPPAGPVPGEPIPSRGNFARSFLALIRPHQWVKNGFVLAPAIFAGSAHHLSVLGRILLAAALFCLASSSIYCLNDLLDAEKDRRHPVKRLRPVASGRITAPVALSLSLVLAAVAFGGSFRLGSGVATVVGGYLILNTVYSLGLKNVVVLDVMVIGISFVLRVVAGAEAAGVVASHWILLCTLLLALFLAFSKRRAELLALPEDPGAHRPSLVGYSPELLDRFDSILLGATIVAYAIYTVSPDTIAKFGSDRLIYGLPFVIFGLFRYLVLVESGKDAGDPGRLALRDPGILSAIVLWAAYNAAVIYSR